MQPRGRCTAVTALLIIGAAQIAAYGRAEQDSPVRAGDAVDQDNHVLVQVAVRRVLGARLFTIEWPFPEHSEVLVAAPQTEATPIAGTMVVVQGVLRQSDRADLKKTAYWNEIDQDTRATLGDMPVLLATSLTTATGRQLIPGARPASIAGSFDRFTLVPSDVEGREAPARHASEDTRGEPNEARVHPAALSELIDELGGRYVTLPRARVIVMLSPRAFLVESAGALPPTKGNLDRVLVMVARGQLRVSPSSLVASTIKVGGMARTLLGVQVTGEVPWPSVLSPELIKRLEIGAAVLATSVQTPDGVDLIERPTSPE